MKKPDINIAEILKKLSFLKNNLGLLVPIVITVVALLLFIPTRILSGQLRETVEQHSVRQGQQISSLVGQIQEAAPAEVMEAYIEAYAEDVNQIEAVMDRTVYRELLAYDVFVDTNETSVGLFERFGQKYQDGVDALIDRLQPGVRPTDDEIVTALNSAPNLDQARGGRGPGRTGGSRSWSSLAMSPIERSIFDEVCTGAARRAKVYASPANVAGYAFWNEWTFEGRDQDQSYKECWYWQLGYWIVEDVIETIRALNVDSQNILDAPVKRLMNVSFRLQQGGMATSASRVRRRQTVDYPTYVKELAEGLTASCTGRVTDATEGIDVVHFQVQVVVDGSQVLPFICQLCSAKTHEFYGFDGKQPKQTYQHNQITVLEATVRPVDELLTAHQGYEYGPNPTMELNLICEYVFPRAPALEELKPKQVKAELAGETEEVY